MAAAVLYVAKMQLISVTKCTEHWSELLLSVLRWLISIKVGAKTGFQYNHLY